MSPQYFVEVRRTLGGPSPIEAARAIENAVITVTREKIKSLAAGRMGYSTGQVGDLVAAAV